MTVDADRAGRGGGKRWIRALLALGLAATVLGLWLHQAGRVAVTPADRAPWAAALRLLDADGRAFSLADLRGKVVLLNLWADWCAPCRVETPRLNRLQRDFASRGLEVLGVNVDQLDTGALKAAQRELQIEYRVAVPLSPFEGSLQPTGTIPQLWLIDRDGRVRASHVGLVPEHGLRQACTTLLTE
jgi:thiol-disulfide isomerase/thioredoxin